jgi:L-alanine-DL-glutamate epimerase-like enolase superfamily enzyme
VPYVPIAELRTHRVSAPLHTPFVTSLRRATAIDSLIVEVLDDEGRAGFGEAPQSWQLTGASAAGAEECVRSVLGPLLIGSDPDDLAGNCRMIQRAVAGNQDAKCAVDVALHDLTARRIGVPLVRLLGGVANRVATTVTLAAGDEASVAAAAVARATEGFSVLKLKVGADAVGDYATVRAVRAAVGPDLRLRLDANEGWSVRDAVRVIRTIEDAGLDVELVEQPVQRTNLDGLAWVSERVDTPIMADESVFDVADLLEVVRRRAADLVGVKLAKCGGITAARALLAIAEAQEVGVVVGTMLESHVGIGAAASLAAGTGVTTVCDLDAAWWLAWSPVRGGPRYVGATVVLSESPGLGINGLVLG